MFSLHLRTFKIFLIVELQFPIFFENCNHILIKKNNENNLNYLLKYERIQKCFK